MLVTRARDNSAYLAFCNLVGGQDELFFDGHSVLDDEGEVLARAPGFEEALLVVDLDPSEAIGRRLRDVRRRALAREREDAREPVLVELEARVRRPRTLAGRARSASSTRARADAEGARAGAPRLRRQERLRRRRPRLSGGIDSALVATLAVDASGPSASTASRCPPATRPRGRRATPSASPRTWAATSELPIEEIVAAFHDAGVGTTGLAAENLQAGPRDDADVALERARLARARDREQVGALRRLLDALRRSRGRLRPDQGRLQDRRLPGWPGS